MATYKCSKCGAMFTEPETKKSHETRERVATKVKEETAQICPLCEAKEDEFNKFDEEARADRWD